jgi:hypothetical protein
MDVMRTLMEDNNQLNLWRFSTGLRGPDEEVNELKSCFTGPVRGQNAVGMVDVMCFPTNGPDKADWEEFQDKAHYHSHIG